MPLEKDQHAMELQTQENPARYWQENLDNVINNRCGCVNPIQTLS